MLEQAVEEERRSKNNLTNNTNKFILPYMISFAVLVFVILFLPVSFNKKLLILFGTTILYVIIGIFATLVLVSKYSRMMGISEVAANLLFGKKQVEILKSDTKTKIEWFTAKLSKARTDKDRLIALGELVSVYLQESIDDKADEYFKMVLQINPKGKREKLFKLDTILGYYDYKDETEKYISTYNENEDILQQSWDMPIILKFTILSRYITYLIITKEYRKALEYYNLCLEFHEKASQIEATYAMSEENKELHCIDYAMLYCKLGEKEKSAESFRVAMKRFENTDKPFLKKHLEKVRGMLDEAEIDYT